MRRTTNQENEEYLKFNSGAFGLIILLGLAYKYLPIQSVKFILLVIVGLYFIGIGYIGGFYFKRFPSFGRFGEIKKQLSRIVGVLLMCCGLLILLTDLFLLLKEGIR
jgi:hypothetical protein